MPNFGKFRTKMIAERLWGRDSRSTTFLGACSCAKGYHSHNYRKTDVQAKVQLPLQKTPIAVDAEKGLVPATRKEDKQSGRNIRCHRPKRRWRKSIGHDDDASCDYPDGFTLPAGTGSRTVVRHLSQQLQ